MKKFSLVFILSALCVLLMATMSVSAEQVLINHTFEELGVDNLGTAETGKICTAAQKDYWGSWNCSDGLSIEASEDIQYGRSMKIAPTAGNAVVDTYKTYTHKINKIEFDIKGSGQVGFQLSLGDGAKTTTNSLIQYVLNMGNDDSVDSGSWGKAAVNVGASAKYDCGEWYHITIVCDLNNAWMRVVIEKNDNSGWRHVQEGKIGLDDDAVFKYTVKNNNTITDRIHSYGIWVKKDTVAYVDNFKVTALDENETVLINETFDRYANTVTTEYSTLLRNKWVSMTDGTLPTFGNGVLVSNARTKFEVSSNEAVEAADTNYIARIGFDITPAAGTNEPKVLLYKNGSSNNYAVYLANSGAVAMDGTWNSNGTNGRWVRGNSYRIELAYDMKTNGQWAKMTDKSTGTVVAQNYFVNNTWEPSGFTGFEVNGNATIDNVYMSAAASHNAWVREIGTMWQMRDAEGKPAATGGTKTNITYVNWMGDGEYTVDLHLNNPADSAKKFQFIDARYDANNVLTWVQVSEINGNDPSIVVPANTTNAKKIKFMIFDEMSKLQPITAIKEIGQQPAK